MLVMPVPRRAVPLKTPGDTWTISTWVHACVVGPPVGRNISTLRLASVAVVVTVNDAVEPEMSPNTLTMFGGVKSELSDQFTVICALATLRWVPVPAPELSVANCPGTKTSCWPGPFGPNEVTTWCSRDGNAALF